MSEKILIVEDDQTLRETLAYNLTRQGFDVAIASDGQAAIDLSHQLKPSLVVLDIMLPILDGYEICRNSTKEIQCADIDALCQG